MLLEDKNAVIYGAGGRVAPAIALAFAREGATVHLVGRTLEPLQAVARQIAEAGGSAEVEQLDALDESAVDAHAAEIGPIDISLNAIGHGDVHGLSLMDMSVEDFVRPVEVAMRSQFITSRAAARQMVERGSGVIMAITATTARLKIKEAGGTPVAFDAIESLSRQWATELGPHGVRVVWLQSTGIGELLPDIQFPAYGTGAPMSLAELIEWNEKETMLGRMTSLEELGNAAAFLASDRASAITGSSINLTAGAVPGR